MGHYGNFFLQSGRRIRRAPIGTHTSLPGTSPWAEYSVRTPAKYRIVEVFLTKMDEDETRCLASPRATHRAAWRSERKRETKKEVLLTNFSRNPNFTAFLFLTPHPGQDGGRRDGIILQLRKALDLVFTPEEQSLAILAWLSHPPPHLIVTRIRLISGMVIEVLRGSVACRYHISPREATVGRSVHRSETRK